MSTKKYTMKSQLIIEIFISLFLLIASILEICFNSPDSSYLVLAWFIILYLVNTIIKKRKVIDDELSEKILSNVNKISINFIMICISIIAMISVIKRTSSIFININILGLVLIVTLLIVTILRLILFIYYDKRGDI